jgi:hypothetical protein
MQWIRDGFVHPSEPIDFSRVKPGYRFRQCPHCNTGRANCVVSQVSILPEIIIYYHHPCANGHCQDAPDIIKEALGDNFEFHFYTYSQQTPFAELPALAGRIPHFPSLIAMRRETFEKLQRKEEIEDQEYEVFRLYSDVEPLKKIVHLFAFSVVNLRKWLGLEKATLP